MDRKNVSINQHGLIDGNCFSFISLFTCKCKILLLLSSQTMQIFMQQIIKLNYACIHINNISVNRDYSTLILTLLWSWHSRIRYNYLSVGVSYNSYVVFDVCNIWYALPFKKNIWTLYLWQIKIKLHKSRIKQC